MRTRTRRAATVALALAGATLVWLVTHRVFPHHSLNHDEAVYLQQAAMLLEGQLFMSPPVEGPFRPWFFVEAGDRLYPKYAPVPAAAFAVGKLLGGYRLALAGVAAGNLALVAALGRELFDARTGLLAGGLLLAAPLFVVESSVFLPYAPTTLLNLGFAVAYLRADRTGNPRVAALAGAAAGLAFFARPYTAVLFAAPFVLHAAWRLGRDPRTVAPRLAATAAVGLGGVGLTLGYNAVVTGSALLFPYEAFAPLDGLGFGTRRILTHEVEYTPDLALRANRRVVTLLFTEWVAGGLLGTALAAVGVGAALRDGRPSRVAPVAGLYLTVVAGNVAFWGNLNVLGDLDRAGDGLVSALGPYYHFDLLVPTAVFGAVGALWLGRRLRTALRGSFDRRTARVLLAVALVLGAVPFGAVTAADVDRRLGENQEVTRTYETVYDAFGDGPPTDAVVLLPTPYGDWLNHPFQRLRNDPGYDGPTVYALADRPFAVADAFPDRRLYRLGYRGAWAPYDGSPRAARLQRVHDVRGPAVRLDATLGVPDRAESVTVRVATDDGSAYFVARNGSGALPLRVTVDGETVTVDGDVEQVDGGTVRLAGRETLRTDVFVDYGAGGGFTYRLSTPVDTAGAGVRALTPVVERCRGAGTCGDGAAYVPGEAPEGVSVRTNLTATDPNA